MREIKFRGKRIDNGQWVHGHYFVAPLTDENSGLPPEAGWFFLNGEKRHCIETDGVVFVIDVKTLGQFIGVFDKYGTEVYEGDILEVVTFGFEPEHFISPIEYVDGRFRFKNGRNLFYFGQTNLTKLDDAVVVGTIHWETPYV